MNAKLSALPRQAREAVVREVELSDPAAAVDAGDAAKVFLVTKLHGHAVGTMLIDRDVAADPVLWRARAREQCAAAIAHHLAFDSVLAAATTTCSERASGITSCHQRWQHALSSGPALTVCIATRGRPGSLKRCLDSLFETHYPRTEIVVVDNAPADDSTATLVRERYGERVTYLVEPTPGLAIAHNRALAAVKTPLVAFTDDDVIVDPWWTTALVAAFLEHPAAAAVTGLIIPDQLDTRAQLLLERHGDFSKGFRRRVFDLAANHPIDTFFPFTAGQLGSGANMAFATAVLTALGGFDNALGAGTLARGGDDLAALVSVIAAGYQLVYEPAAAVRHRHRRTVDALRRQAFGYGVGLGAFLTAASLRHRRLALRIACHLPSGAHFAFASKSERNRDRYAGWPPSIAWRERLGLLLGPIAYGASVLKGRRSGVSSGALAGLGQRSSATTPGSHRTGRGARRSWPRA